jgi:hypothetical protein
MWMKNKMKNRNENLELKLLAWVQSLQTMQGYQPPRFGSKLGDQWKWWNLLQLL